MATDDDSSATSGAAGVDVPVGLEHTSASFNDTRRRNEAATSATMMAPIASSIMERGNWTAGNVFEAYWKAGAEH